MVIFTPLVSFLSRPKSWSALELDKSCNSSPLLWNALAFDEALCVIALIRVCQKMSLLWKCRFCNPAIAYIEVEGIQLQMWHTFCHFHTLYFGNNAMKHSIEFISAISLEKKYTNLSVIINQSFSLIKSLYLVYLEIQIIAGTVCWWSYLLALG